MDRTELLKKHGFEGAELLATLPGVEVPRHMTRDERVPALQGKDQGRVLVLGPNGNRQIITATDNPSVFNIRFVGQTANTTITLSIYYKDESQPAPQPVESAPILEPPPRTESRLTTLSRTFKEKAQALNPGLAKLQKEHKALKAEKRRQQAALIRTQSLDSPGLKDKSVLTLDHCGCWARALGMIQLAVRFEHKLGCPLHEYYDRITGQGDGAIIAAAFASGMSAEQLGRWWREDWRKAHTPNLLSQTKRWALSKLGNQSGFDAAKARKALQRLFSDKRSGKLLTMADLRAELHITVIQADFKVSTHMSYKQPSTELWAACEDSAITKLVYNQRQTIKGEAVFLGAIEKNDALGMAVSPDNDNLRITSIGAPVRVDPDGALDLAKADAEADKKALQSEAHFIYERRVEQVIAKLKSQGAKIKYFRLECAAIDGVVANSTTNRAMELGRKSGELDITPPEWFKIKPQISLLTTA